MLSPLFKWLRPKSKPSAPELEVESLCNNTCEMDWANNICKGCYRTPNEIGAWSSLTAESKLAVNAAAHERRADATGA